MKKIFFVFCLLALSVKSYAMVEISCWDQDCLKNGWTWFDTTSGEDVSYSCYQDGCEASGWIVGTDPKSYTQCKDGGCFKVGWDQIDSGSQTFMKEIVCRGPSDAANDNSDCLKYGWVSYSRYGQETVVTCFENDCANKGWLIQNETLSHAYCKQGGCFRSGWREF